MAGLPAVEFVAALHEQVLQQHEVGVRDRVQFRLADDFVHAVADAGELTAEFGRGHPAEAAVAGAGEFERADALRDQLAEQGYEVRDTADGPVLVRLDAGAR